MDYGIWSVSSKAGSMPVEAFGFIYTITNRSTGKSYIGKKQLNSYSMKKVPGKIRRVKEVKESNWRTYQSSSKKVKADIKTHGQDNFAFVIEEWCCTRAELTYRECELQWQYDVLSRDTLPNGERKWYNEAIGAIKFIAPEFCTDSTRAKISERTKLAMQDPEVRAKLSANAKKRVGTKHPKFLGSVIGISIATGETITLVGNADMQAKGFQPGNICRVLKGERLHCKGYIFERKDEYESGTTN